MILHRLTANFGCLSHSTLSLTPGLNIIEAPNESGKSTWCAFLRVMLYGLRTGRGRNGLPSDKERYSPWDGSPMSGVIDLTWKDAAVTLRRSSEGSAGPLRSFSAVYTGTNQSVSALTESDVGETLTSLSAEVFARTAFIGSAGLKVGTGPELEKYIAASVTSGEEGVSYTEAAERLRNWQRRYRYRGQGRLPEQERELLRLEKQQREYTRLTGELAQLEQREQHAAAVYSEWTDRLDVSARERDLSHRQEQKRQEELLRREREASALRSALQSSPFAGETPDEAFQRRARADSRRSTEYLRDEKAAPTAGVWMLCLFLAAVCAGAGLWKTLFFLPAALLLSAGLWFWYRSRRTREQRARRNRELAALRRRYGTTVPKEMLASAREYAQRYREMLSLQAAAEELRARTPEKEQADMGASAAVLTTLSGELRAVAAQKARLLAERDVLGEPEELSQREDSLRTEHDRDLRTSAALDVALAELTAADEEMQRRYAPALSQRTEEIFRALTGGRYESLKLDRNLTAAVGRKEDMLPHTEAYLSRGTIDQLYLALRLALCEPNTDCPIILDDALVHFDDERLGYALDYLRALAQERQILLFTCQHREKRYLEETDPR